MVAVNLKVSKPDGDYRCNDAQKAYFDNDMSKFIGCELPVTFTSMNGDIVQYKRDYDWFRIIEVKHVNEGGADTQKELLRKLRKKCPPSEGVHFEVYLARGDVGDNMDPFKAGIEITDLTTNQTIHLSREEMCLFFTFTIGYRNIDEIIVSRGATATPLKVVSQCDTCSYGPCIDNGDDTGDCALYKPVIQI